MDFIGNNKLTALLRERVSNYNPRALATTLNNVQEEEALEVLDRYIGDFTYVLATGGFGYGTFLVRTNGGLYTFRVQQEDLPARWHEVVPSRYELVFA
jgi:hypothetical protein